MKRSRWINDSPVIPHLSEMCHLPRRNVVPIFRQALPNSLGVFPAPKDFSLGRPSGKTRLAMTPERRAPDTILRTAEIQHERVTIVKRIGVDGAVRILSAIIKAENRISLFHWKTQPELNFGVEKVMRGNCHTLVFLAIWTRHIGKRHIPHKVPDFVRVNEEIIFRDVRQCHLIKVPKIGTKSSCYSFTSVHMNMDCG